MFKVFELNFKRQRTNFSLVLYALYLVTLGLSYRKASNAIKVFVERSHVAIWKWVQRIHGFRKIFKVNCRVSIFLVDETAVNVAGKLAWVWVAYEPYSKKILGFWLSRTRNSYEAELFLRSLIKLHGRHVVYTDGAPFYIEACRSLNLVHRTYEFGDWFFEVIEREVQFLKDRTENFDDYFPCSKKVCRLDHVWRWLNLFHLFNQEEVIKIVQKFRVIV